MWRNATLIDTSSKTFRSFQYPSAVIRLHNISFAALLNINVGEVVALHTHRSEKIIIAQLAVLKSGGVFLPIDTTVPTERMRDMLEDCQAKLLIVDNDDLSVNGIKTLNIDSIVLDKQHYFSHPVDMVVIHGANHYFHTQRADEVAKAIIKHI